MGEGEYSSRMSNITSKILTKENISKLQRNYLYSTSVEVINIK